MYRYDLSQVCKYSSHGNSVVFFVKLQNEIYREYTFCAHQKFLNQCHLVKKKQNENLSKKKSGTQNGRFCQFNSFWLVKFKQMYCSHQNKIVKK